MLSQLLEQMPRNCHASNLEKLYAGTQKYVLNNREILRKGIEEIHRNYATLKVSKQIFKNYIKNM